jgi:RimJ/RimL family protein N-acetyltransferase
MSERQVFFSRYGADHEELLLGCVQRGLLIGISSDVSVLAPGCARDEVRRRVNDGVLFPVLLTENGVVSGVIAFNTMDNENAVVNLCCTVENDRYTAEDLGTILRWCAAFAFDGMNFHRVYGYLRVPDRSFREAAVAAGFTVEGTLRHASYDDGVRGDRLVLGTLRQTPHAEGS